MTTLLLFAFLAGFVTILAPCIWPLLPIVLSASTGVGKSRPLGITLGVMTSFTIFTLSISYLEKFLHINPNHFRLIAVIIIILLGISMLIPSIGTHFENFINRLLRPFQNKIQKQGTGFWAGYLTGFSIGLVWAPCAGPILATVATLAATQAVNVKVILVTLAYVSGLGIPLFFFSLFGSWCFSRMRQLNKFTGRIQQIFGLIMIAAAVLIYTNYDKVIQIKILNLFPSYGNIFNKIENNDHVGEELSKLRGQKEKTTVTQTASGLPILGNAPEFSGIAQWLNSSPLTMEQLKGKVILIDFWTYSCINCVRTLPHVTGWYEKYKDKNFIVIGIHTPEFAFEKESNNVQNAIKQFKINYPVALDNNYQTWKAFDNHYWPAEYLIDAKGQIRRTHFGEGKYDEMENAIRELLQESGNVIDVQANFLADQTPRYNRTPETYLGKARAERFSSPETLKIGMQNFTFPETLSKNHFAYQGTWIINEESATTQQNSTIKFHFSAGQVFLVIGPHSKGDKITILLDDAKLSDNKAGADVLNGELILDQYRLYHLIDLRGEIGSHTLELKFNNDNITVYAFTFG